MLRTVDEADARLDFRRTGERTPAFVRFSSVADERVPAADVRGFAVMLDGHAIAHPTCCTSKSWRPRRDSLSTERMGMALHRTCEVRAARLHVKARAWPLAT